MSVQPFAKGSGTTYEHVFGLKRLRDCVRAMLGAPSNLHVGVCGIYLDENITRLLTTRIGAAGMGRQPTTPVASHHLGEYVWLGRIATKRAASCWGGAHVAV